MVVFVLNTNDRAQIRLYAGSNTDYNLNTPCNEGLPATNDGVYNCFTTSAKYIHVVYDDTGGGTCLVWDELFVHSEFDAAQYGTLSLNGYYSQEKPVLGHVPVDTTTNYLRLFDYNEPNYGALRVDITHDVSKAFVLLY